MPKKVLLRNISIRNKLATFIALCVGVSGLLIAGYVSWGEYRNAQDELEEQAWATVQLFQQVLLDPSRMTDDYRIYELISAPFKVSLLSAAEQKATNHYLDHILLLNDAGRVLATSDPQRIPLNSVHAEQEAGFAEVEQAIPSIRSDSSPQLLHPKPNGHLYMLAPIGESGLKYSTLLLDYSLDELNANTRREVSRAVFIIVLITLLLMLLARVIAGRFVLPLVMLRDEVRELAVSRNLRINNNDIRGDEIECLNVVFSEFVQALNRAEKDRDYFQERAELALVGLESSLKASSLPTRTGGARSSTMRSARSAATTMTIWLANFYVN